MPAPPPDTPVSEAQESAALIAQIASEARASTRHKGRTALVPDAEGQRAGKPRVPGEPGADDAAEASDDTDPNDLPDTDDAEVQDIDAEEVEGDGEEAEASDADEETEQSDDAEEEEQEAAEPSGAVDIEKLDAVLKADGDLDVVALADALGVAPERLKVTPAQHKAIRLEKKKAKAFLDKAKDLEVRLGQRYGDQIKARNAAAEGTLEPAIEYIEATFGMPWNDINKMVGALLEGKPVEGIEHKIELKKLRDEKAAREKAEAEQRQQQETVAKVAKAKDWIALQIKKDPLADAGLNAKLSAAGLKTVTELVYEEMQEGYAKGLTDPKAALAKVKLRLAKQAKALAAAGLSQPAKVEKKAAVTVSKPRAEAQRGSANNRREMTDAEMRRAALKESGLRVE